VNENYPVAEQQWKLIPETANLLHAAKSFIVSQCQLGAVISNWEIITISPLASFMLLTTSPIKVEVPSQQNKQINAARVWMSNNGRETVSQQLYSYLVASEESTVDK